MSFREHVDSEMYPLFLCNLLQQPLDDSDEGPIQKISREVRNAVVQCFEIDFLTEVKVQDGLYQSRCQLQQGLGLRGTGSRQNPSVRYHS